MSTIRYAMEVAVRRGRQVRLVHAIPGGPTQAADASPQARGPGPGDDFLTLLARVVPTLRDPLGPPVRVTVDTPEGFPVGVLVRAARDASLLVLGAAPHPDPGRLSSVRARVAGRAACPVLTVPAGWREPATPLVVAATAHPSRTGPALEAGIALAAEIRAALRAIHVTPDPAHVPDAARALRAVVRGVVDGVRGDLGRSAASELDVEVVVAAGPPSPVLAGQVGEASLLVVGRRSPDHPAWPQVGPITAALLHTARCPVLVVDAPPGGDQLA